jgi:mRNA-degrading endonuclease toxin of MazEF toxin-antitoxin module
MFEPGEIYWADLTEAHRRPVIIVSREELNRGNRVTVVQVTSAHFARRSILPNCVPFCAGVFGLTRDCVAQCDHVLSLNVAQVDASGLIGVLDDAAMRELIRAIGYVFDADCEPT